MLTVRQLKAFIENMPEEWDDEIVAYADFSNARTLSADLCHAYQGVVISDGDEAMHTYSVSGKIMEILSVEED